MVDACARHLLTSHGLRSLDPRHPDYKGHHGGDRQARDAAYHQGTVWGWLIGPFVSAHLRVYRDPALARSFLWPFIQELDAHCVGRLSEIFDGNPPHTRERFASWYECSIAGRRLLGKCTVRPVGRLLRRIRTASRPSIGRGYLSDLSPAV